MASTFFVGDIQITEESMSIETVDVALNYINTCLSCFLTDFHDRPGELLVDITPRGQTEDEAVDEILTEINATLDDRGPDVDNAVIEAAIRAGIRGRPFEVGDEVDEDADYARVWFYLSWQVVIKVTGHLYVPYGDDALLYEYEVAYDGQSWMEKMRHHPECAPRAAAVVAVALESGDPALRDAILECEGGVRVRKPEDEWYWAITVERLDLQSEQAEEPYTLYVHLRLARRTESTFTLIIG